MQRAWGRNEFGTIEEWPLAGADQMREMVGFRGHDPNDDFR